VCNADGKKKVVGGRGGKDIDGARKKKKPERECIDYWRIHSVLTKKKTGYIKQMWKRCGKRNPQRHDAR